jgi:hypothetical protein
MLVLLFAAGAVIWIRSFADMSHQDRNIHTAKASLFTLALLLIWLPFLSRLRWGVRFAGFGAVVGLVVLSAALLRMRGVTGDLVPILEWRWKQPTSAGLSEGQLTKSTAANKLVLRRPGIIHNSSGRAGMPRFTVRFWRAIGKRNRPKNFGANHRHGLVRFRHCRQSGGDAGAAGRDEMVTAYEPRRGDWFGRMHAAHYNTTIAGEGPRATPHRR